MLSYQHGYHAGNLADLHKHIVLATIWRTLKRKPRPLSYIDTHAGRGRYLLDDAFAEKTGEWKEGIGLFQSERGEFAKLVAQHQKLYGKHSYLGSVGIIDAMRGEDDRIICAELHPQEYAALKSNFGDAIEAHKRDGYEMLLALSPPKPRRGLVMIDPSYEIKTEYMDVVIAVRKLLIKWPESVITIWYPILESNAHHELEDNLRLKGRMICKAEFDRNSKLRMKGTAMMIINAPYGLKPDLQSELSYCEKQVHRLKIEMM